MIGEVNSRVSTNAYSNKSRQTEDSSNHVFSKLLEEKKEKADKTDKTDQTDKTDKADKTESKTESDIVVKADGSRVLMITTTIGGMETTMSLEISKPTDLVNDERNVTEKNKLEENTVVAVNENNTAIVDEVEETITSNSNK